MKLCVLVACHKPYPMAKDKCYIPVEVGAALHSVHPEGFLPDNTGDNISNKNEGYCELTALYWAWKNLDCDALGLVHYRRYFGKRGLFGRREGRIAGSADFEAMLEKAPVILPRSRNYVIETNYSQYAHAHHGKDLNTVREILTEKYPEYVPAFDASMARTSGHHFNMFVMRKDIADGYCAWLFSVLSELEKRVDISGYDPYNRRLFGFIGERLMDGYLETNRISCVEMPVVNLESQHWPKKAAAFLYRKFRGKGAT